MDKTAWLTASLIAYTWSSVGLSGELWQWTWLVEAAFLKKFADSANRHRNS